MSTINAVTPAPEGDQGPEVAIDTRPRTNSATISAEIKEGSA